MFSRTFCVIVPFYNNCKTVCNVINSIICEGYNVLAISDGSKDNSLQLLLEYYNSLPQQKKNLLSIKVINKNRGKGYALKQGFKILKERGFSYAISFDADGQHTIKGLKLLVTKLSQLNENKAILVGCRYIKGADGNSKFANKFSNFWFKVHTLRNLDDTQSGMRAYPLELVSNKFYLSNRYEFETEVLVKSAWCGAKFYQVPIDVVYDQSRVTHFRPFIDFFRISLINTYLTILTPLYGYPKMFITRLLYKE